MDIWELRSSGMLCSADNYRCFGKAIGPKLLSPGLFRSEWWQFLTDVSGQRIGSI